MVPSQSYQFDHPEGTGHDTGSPFESMWFVHLPSSLALKPNSSVHAAYVNPKGASGRDGGVVHAKLLSYQDLGANKIVRTERRLNPRQRKAMLKKGKGGGKR